MREPDPEPRPRSELRAGDFAMIKTSNPSDRLNGMGVTIKRVTYVLTEKKYRYTCASDELGSHGTTLSIAAEDLVKANYKLGDSVNVSIGRAGGKTKLEGTVQGA
jgi:hypothetical protein